jgi:hypothetical protein
MVNKRTIKKLLPLGAIPVQKKEDWNFFYFPGKSQDEMIEWRNEMQRTKKLSPATLYQTLGPHWKPCIEIMGRVFAYHSELEDRKC